MKTFLTKPAIRLCVWAFLGIAAGTVYGVTASVLWSSIIFVTGSVIATFLTIDWEGVTLREGFFLTDEGRKRLRERKREMERREQEVQLKQQEQQIEKKNTELLRED